MRRPGVGAARRGGFRGIGGGAPLVAPVNTVAPVASGTRGGTLSCTTGTWTGSPTFTYQWQAAATLGGGGSFANIVGATSSTFDDSSFSTITAPYDVRCIVTATNAAAPSGVTANSNTLAAYTPESNANNKLWWNGSSLSNGAVASWVDEIGAIDMAQGTGTKQPSAASGVVTSDGGDVLVSSASVAALSGLTAVCVTFDWVDTDTGSTAKMIWELTTSVATQNGSIAAFVNDAGTDRMCAGARGTAGATIRRASDAASSAAVWTMCFDLSVAGEGAVVAIRKNGTALSLTNTSTASAAGSLASAALHFFGRGATPTLGVAGGMKTWVLLNGSTAAELANNERFAAAARGLSW